MVQRVAAFVLLLLTGVPHPAALIGNGSVIDRAAAQSSDAEKDAFEAAKALGTVEAWDAFLSHYPTGFHADLARAYVKQLAAAPAQGTYSAPQPVYDYPMVAGTWGGIVRSGPGQDNSKVASLKEGEEVTLMAPPIPVTPNDYPWFKIAFRDGKIGYMWGGILCSTGAERPDVFRLCTFEPYRAGSGEAAEAKPVNKKPSTRTNGAPSWCASPSNGAEQAICRNGDLIRLDSVMNVAYRRAKADSPQSVGEIEREQRHWLSRRDACGDDAQCVMKRYNEQIPLLESFFGN
jgi:uncharacterized protein YecT (DUF1311 family)